MSITATFNDLLTDTLYVAIGPGVYPMLTGAPKLATWRSKVITLDNFAGFGFLRVNGNLSAGGCVVRLYRDGVLFYTTPVITTRTPVRIPSGKARQWEVEVQSSDRIVSVEMATSLQELL